MTLDKIKTPALLLDKNILQQNLIAMQNRADRFGVGLRPHIKTHKCIEIAKDQVKLGAKGITVSTFYEAVIFADAGFNDILWAFPIIPAYIDDALNLSEKITFRVLIDSLEAFEDLETKCLKRGKEIHVWLEIDCGQHRSGVNPKLNSAEELATILVESKYLIFDGILTHAGHSYLAKTRDEIKNIAEQERLVMVEFVERMKKKSIEIPAVSIGSTPTISVSENFDGVTEIRPGNYVFYDYTQLLLGNCKLDNCALTVLSSVISHQPEADYFIIDSGALALSKDAGPIHLQNDYSYGIIFEDYKAKIINEQLKIKSLTQEHGKVVADRIIAIKEKYRVSSKVRILENHSCLTAAMFDEYKVVSNNEVVEKWKILRGR
ncbi:MAG: alanine racemase [Bacteroidota bacterium]|nr:alanine racemase [Bacteroidota bacterium]